MVADANYVGHLPTNVEFVQIAPILCAGITVYKGLKISGTQPGDWVVVSGGCAELRRAYFCPGFQAGRTRCAKYGQEWIGTTEGVKPADLQSVPLHRRIRF